jgi:hypothetical protein
MTVIMNMIIIISISIIHSGSTGNIAEFYLNAHNTTFFMAIQERRRNPRAGNIYLHSTSLLLHFSGLILLKTKTHSSHFATQYDIIKYPENL